MQFLDGLAILDSISGDFIIAVASSATTLITGYILLRERLIKNELKIENIYDYIDNRNKLFETRLTELQGDLHELKEVNKEATKSLAENTSAIKELKIVLSIVTDKLNKNY